MWWVVGSIPYGGFIELFFFFANTPVGVTLAVKVPSVFRMMHVKEGEKANVLFNDALNTFYLQLYGVGYMVNNHSESEIKETHWRLSTGYSFSISSKGSFISPSHRQDNTYHGLCYTSLGALAGTRNSSMGPPHEGSIRRPTAP